MKIDSSKGVARSSHMVGAPRPRNEEDDSDDSADEGTVDDAASTRHRGGHDAVGYKAIKSGPILESARTSDSRAVTDLFLL
jgi:hypothetical protein